MGHCTSEPATDFIEEVFLLQEHIIREFHPLRFTVRHILYKGLNTVLGTKYLE